MTNFMFGDDITKMLYIFITTVIHFYPFLFNGKVRTSHKNFENKVHIVTSSYKPENIAWSMLTAQKDN